MTKFLVLAGLAICLSTSLHAEKILSGNAAWEKIYGTEKIRYTENSSLPGFIRISPHFKLSPDGTESWLKTSLNLSPAFSLKLTGMEVDHLGFSHYRYVELWNGLEVETSAFIVDVKDGRVVSMNGFITESLPSASQSVLDENNARIRAIAKMDATLYKWEVPNEEAHLKLITRNPDATYLPSGTMTYLPGSAIATGHLAWKFDIYAVRPLARQYVFVDALTGEVVKTIDRIHTSDSAGTAITKYSGAQPIIADHTGSQFRLRE